MSWVSVQLRRLADARVAAGGLIALALVTSFLFAVAPRVIDIQADAALRSTVDAATSATRNIAVSQTGRIEPGSPDPLTPISTDGDQFFEQFPASLAALVQARYATVDTARFLPLGLEGRTVRLRYLDDATEHVRLVSGRFPTGQTTQTPVAPGLVRAGSSFGQSGPVPDSLTTFEVALSTASAHDLGVVVGDTLQLRSDTADPLTGAPSRYVASASSYLAIDIVGIYDVPDGSADYWFADTSLERPQIRSLSSLNQIDDTTVLFSAAAYPALLNATSLGQMQFRYTWRYEIDSSRLRADDAGILQTDLRRMESVFLAEATSSTQLHVSGQLSAPVLQNGLLSLLETYSGGWRAVSQILSVAEVGSGAVALLALSLVCLLAGRRRARSLALWQSRGASRLHAVGGALVEIALALAVPVAAGAALAIALTPSRPAAPTLLLSGGVLAFASTLVLATTWGANGDPGAGPAGDQGGGGRGGGGYGRGAGPRRLVLEAAVVVGAVVGAFILRQRGVASAGASTVLASPDPLLAAVPALTGGAAALAVARLLPIPLDLLARLAERRRGLVASLALRRATRRTNGRLMLTALLAMAAVWSFAAISLSYMSRASDADSWLSVGAAYRIDLQEGSIPPDFVVADLPGVEAASSAAVLSGHVPDSTAQVSVLAIDLAAYRDVVAGGWLDGTVPQSMIDAEAALPVASPSAPAGGAQVSGAAPASAAAPAPLPAIVSTTFAGDAGLGLGDTFEVVVGGARPTFSVAAIRDAFPTLSADVPWMVVPRRNLAAVVAGGEVAPTEVFIKAGPDAGATIARALQNRLPAQGVVYSRFDAVAALRDAPDYAAVVFGLAAASLVAALYGALAIFVALLLAGAEQSRESAHLRVLGLSRGENLGLSAMEHGPAAVLVIVAGMALGAGLFAFLQSGLGLGQLVGGDVEVGLPIEPAWVAAVFGAIAAMVGLAVLLETAAESIIKTTAALRGGLD